MRLVSFYYTWFDFHQLPLDRIINILPENIIIIKDSGCWSIMDEDFNSLIESNYNSDLKELAIKYLLTLPLDEVMAWNVAEAFAQ